LPPFTEPDGIQGKDFIIQTAVRRLDDPRLEDELGEVEGPVFVVRMTQLVKDPAATDDKLILSAWNTNNVLKGGITDPDEPGSVIDNHLDFPKAVIAFKAEFFRLRANKFNYVTSSNWDFQTIGNAVTEVNIAVRR